MNFSDDAKSFSADVEDCKALAQNCFGRATHETTMWIYDRVTQKSAIFEEKRPVLKAKLEAERTKQEKSLSECKAVAEALFAEDYRSRPFEVFSDIWDRLYSEDDE